MNSFPKSAALASALLVQLCVPSHAMTYSLGTLGSYNSLIVGVTAPSFTDDYTFNIAKPSYVTADYAYDFLSLLGSASTTVDLLGGSPPNGVNLGDNYTGDATLAMGSSSFIYGPLAAGSYYVEVAGPGGVSVEPNSCMSTPDSCPGEEESKYQLQIYVNPTPLPSALYGFLGSIAVIGFFAWISKRRDPFAYQASRSIST